MYAEGVHAYLNMLFEVFSSAHEAFNLMRYKIPINLVTDTQLQHRLLCLVASILNMFSTQDFNCACSMNPEARLAS